MSVATGAISRRVQCFSAVFNLARGFPRCHTDPAAVYFYSETVFYRGFFIVFISVRTTALCFCFFQWRHPVNERQRWCPNCQLTKFCQRRRLMRNYCNVTDSGMEEKANGSVDTKSPVENGQVPDPANWGVADVVNYFKATGFEEQATAFQDQEIDGKSLLLMTRNDVLTGLSIKLGPALKIYEYHVKPLQTQHLKSNAS